MLVNPNSEVAGENTAYSRFVPPVASAGIAYIAALLEKEGNDVMIVDQYANKMTNEQLLRKIYIEKPQIIGFSCLTPTIKNVERLVIQIKKSNKEVRIVLGNTHATIFVEELLNKKIADIVVRGEGEYTMLEIIKAIEQKRELHHVEGVSFVENGKVFHNPDRKVVENLDELPYPAWYLFNLQLYKNHPLVSLYEITLPIQGSRGCPYQCIFCSQEWMYKKSRYRQINNIISEIEYIHNKLGVKNFVFIDAFFPFSIEYGLEFCDKLIQKGLHKKVKWVIETRVDKVNFKLLKKMKEAGLHLIMYGFEVGNQRVLDSLNKRTTLEQARKAMKDTRRAGIRTTGLFILGMPGETKETCEETIRFAKELDCDIAKFNLAVPLPGSRFFEVYKDKLSDIGIPEKFTSWSSWLADNDSLAYVPEGMTAKELINLQTKAMFKYYVGPKLIIRCIVKRIISPKVLYYGAYVLIIKYFKIIIARITKIINLKERCDERHTYKP